MVIDVEAGTNVGVIESETFLFFATFVVALTPLFFWLFPVAFVLFVVVRLPVFFAVC
jgi:hypothetical protein